MTFECLTCPKEIQDKNCISSGHFCYFPPANEVSEKFSKVSIHHLIWENLREKCIYEVVGDKKDEQDGHTFLNYMNHIHKDCLLAQDTLDEVCAEEVMRQQNISVQSVNACISDSFATPGDWTSYNVMLGIDREYANHMGI